MKTAFLDKNLFLAAAFLNAFVDLAHKITLQNTVFVSMSGSKLLIFSQIVNALILLPFVLLFVPAGELNDRNSKLENMRVLAIAAIVLTTIITFFYYLGLFWAAFVSTLLLAAQSALYSPAKFAFVKEISKDGEIAKLNSYLQMLSIVAILLSTLLFSALFDLLNTHGNTQDKGAVISSMTPLGMCMIFLSILEFLCLKKIKTSDIPPHAPMSRAQKKELILKNDTVFASFVLLSIFYAVSQSVMASFPSFAKEELGIKEAFLMQLPLGISALGVMAGSFVAGRYKNQRHRVAFSFFGMLFYSISIGGVLEGYANISFFVIGVCAGFVIVSLNTVIQESIDRAYLSSAASLSNLYQNILMLLFLGLSTIAAFLSVKAYLLLLLCAIIAFFAAIYSLFVFPHPIIEAFIGALFRFRYKFVFYGKLPQSERGVLLIGNHTSFIDWAFLQMAINRKIHFLIEKEIFEKPLLKPFLKFFGALPIDKTHAKESLKKAIMILKNGGVVAIFPEGELSKDGEIGEFKAGFELLAKRGNAIVVPFFLGGLFGSRFSKKSDGKYKKREVKLIFAEPLEDVSRAAAKKAVANLSLKI